MKRIHADNTKLSSQVNFLPVIEGDPNDHRTIFTTLKECMRLSENKITIVTFDLPIWLKAVDIIKSENVSIIPRLGGFHLLKSFLGSSGNIMDDSGLLEVINSFASIGRTGTSNRKVKVMVIYLNISFMT